MKYAIANWKMAPKTKEAASALIGALSEELRTAPRGVQVVLCPPFLWLPIVAQHRSGSGDFALGAQDVAPELQGAHTGEISPAMLSSVGASYVLIGHSERRAIGEDNAMVSRKLRVALDGGLTAILCVGEQSRSGDWHLLLRAQLESAFAVMTPADLGRILVAYEPVWAIGGSVPDTPDDALTAAMFIRKIASAKLGDRARTLPVLYGGSVEAKTVAPFAKEEGLDGVLVGHASLDAIEFVTIVRTLAEPS